MHSHLKGHPALIDAVRRLEQLGTDKFELYYTRKAATKIDCKNQEVESLTRSEDVGLSIRLMKNQRMGFSFTTSLESDAIERAVTSAHEIAQFMPEDEHADLVSFGSTVYPEVDSYDAKGLAVAMEKKIAMAKNIEMACRKADSRIQGVRSASLSERAYEIHMVDSNGEHIQHQGTMYSASVLCKADQDGDGQMGGEMDFSNYLDNLDVEKVGRMAAGWATELLGAGTAPTMKCPAVLRNSVVAELIEFLSSSFSAEEIAKGRSLLAGKQGERLFSENVHLIDDGLLAGGYASSPFDGEGVPSGKIELVQGGFVSGALYNTYYARKNGTASTASAVRSVSTPPTIGSSNLYMQKGRKSYEDLFDGVTKGILITDLMGLHTANPVTGDFSLGASGILIENGKLTRPVKGFAVAGNVLDLFRRMTDVASDLRFFGNVGAPSARISELSVGGT